MVAQSTALVVYEHDGIDRTFAWAQLADDERKRRALHAAVEHDTAALWDLTVDWLILRGRKGATVSPRTIEAYETGVQRLLADWRTESLLRPARLSGASWVREARDLKPRTVQVYLASARALYRALRGVGATDVDPFLDVQPAPDPVPPEEKRKPYTAEEVDQLLTVAEGIDRLVVLLGAKEGLRNSEMQKLCWEDIDLVRGDLTVQCGKGGRKRTIPIASSLLPLLIEASLPFGSVLPHCQNRWAIGHRMKKLCKRAGVTHRAVHSLRHTAGTELVRQGNSVQDAKQLLGHRSVSTTEIYITYSDETLRLGLQGW